MEVNGDFLGAFIRIEANDVESVSAGRLGIRDAVGVLSAVDGVDVADLGHAVLAA